MQIIDGSGSFNAPNNAVVTSGTFDGVHVGHQKILKRLTNLAKATGGQSVVLTFWPHPRFILKPNDDSLKLLSTLEEKTKILSELGIDYVVKIPFTKEFSQMSSEVFIQSILVEKLKTKKLVIGYDHRFGKNREGGFDYLKENETKLGFEVEEIPRQDIDDVGVSSTKIRNALLEMDIETANAYLGRHYTIKGEVMKGIQVGRAIGFPTANIKIPEPYKLIPNDGVYAVRIDYNNQTFDGMLNIGMRPTVEGRERTIEVNIFDFDGDLYGQSLNVKFIKSVRTEKKFEDITALQKQLEKDKKEVIKMLKNHS